MDAAQREKLVRIAAKRNKEAVEKALGKKGAGKPTNPFIQYAQPTKK